MKRARAGVIRRWGWLLTAIVLMGCVFGPVAAANAVELPTISGQVTGPDGVGIPGVLVRAVNSISYMTDDYGSTVTGFGGFYTLPVGTPTNVIVMFEPADSNVANSTDFIGECYGNTAYVLSATYVAPGASGINAELAEGGSVAGTVYEPAGSPGVVGIEVEARTGSVFDPSAVTVAGGAYVLRGVPSGMPTIAAVTAQYNLDNDTDFVNATAGTSVTPGAQTTGVDITLGQGGRIEGTVTGGGLELSDIGVSVQDTVGFMPPFYSADTGTDGSYVLRGVPAGTTYRAYFSSARHNLLHDASFASEYYDNARLAADYTPVSVTAGSTTSGIGASLEVGGSVSGTVYAPDGLTPLAGIRVYEPYTNASDWTDAYGQYSLGGFNTGNAAICFDPTEYNEIYGAAYNVEYYDNSTWLTTATFVPVTFGEDTPGINATLAGFGPTSGAIAGVVFGPDGETGLGGILVMAAGTSPASTYSQPDGTFLIGGLAPGTYDVFFDPTEYNATAEPDLPGQPYFEPVAVVVGDASLLSPVSLGGGGGLSTFVDADPAFPGAFGWYFTAPTITLTCTDPTATIWYFWGTDAPAEYTGPLTAPEGVNTLTVWAEDSLGNEEPQNTWDFSVDTVAPDAPTNLSAVSAGPNSVDLSWDAALDDTSGVDYYKVHVDGVYTGMWSGTTFQAVGLDPGTEYSFTVTAVDWAGHESAVSDAALATTDPDTGGGGLAPVFRLYQTTNGSVLLTSDQGEAQSLLTGEPEKFISEGIAFFTDPALDTAPVWRFRNIAEDVYVYTSSPVSRDFMISSSFMFEFQGVAFSCSPVPTATPIYGFYRPAVGDHYCTASLAERDYILATLGGTYVYEGITMFTNGSLTTAAGTGSISGTVLDDLGATLGGVWVRATGPDGSWSAITEGDGTYSIGGLPDNDYVVTFSTWPNSETTGWNLLPEYHPNAHTYGDALPVTIAAGGAQTGIDAQLEGPGPDLAAPITSITATGTVGLDGWYSTEPSITLTPNEPATTYYTWDGVDIQQFTASIHPALGISALQFWSEDLVGNIEDARIVGFKFDNVLPTTPAGLSAVQSSVDGDVTLTWTSSTDTVSGMLRYLAFEQVGMGWSQVATITPEPGASQSYVLPGRAEGGHTYAVVAQDVAGNRSAYSTSDFVSVDRTTPTTSAVVSGGSISNAWYVTAPTVTLWVSELGCRTYYHWGADAPAEYIGPLTAPDGINTISFWSEDAVGHVESLESTGPISVDTIPPAGVTGLTAVADGSFAVDLSWDPVTTDIFGDPEVSGVAEYTVVVDLDSYTTTETSFKVTGLMPDTYYEFGVIASDVPGNPGPTVITSATTDPDLTAPTTTLDAAGGTTGANGWYTAAPSITLTADEPGTTWYQWDTDASPTEYTGAFEPIAGEHTLTFWSEDLVGNVEDPKLTQAFKLDTTAPATPTGLSAGQTAPGSITISWNAASDAESGLDTHVLAQSGPQNGGWNVPGTTYTVTGLAEGTYSYTIEAVNGAGLHSAASEVVQLTVDNTAPTTTLAADPAAANGAGGWYVTAPAITLTSEPGAIIFYHWDATPEAEYAAPLAPADGTHTLNYSSEDLVGNVETNKTATFKVDTVDPSAPTGLVATAPSFNTVGLSWAAATDETSGIAKYRIYQGATFLTETTALTYQVTGLTGDTPYSFTITAVDVAGNEGPASAAGDVRTPGEPLTGTFVIDGGATYNTTKLLAFTSDVPGAAEMRIRASADGGATWGSWGEWAAYAASADVGVGADGTWTYEVEYRNGARGVTLQDAITVDSTAPTAPTGLAAAATSTSEIDLSWTAATDATSGVAKYKVYKNGVFLAEVSGTDYQATGLTAGTAYTFTVTAVDTVGLESAQSASASATTLAGPQPVHRFYNFRLGTHFYTADPREFANVFNNMRNTYTYDGVGYYVNPDVNTQPLYRFFRPSTGTHFYTADPAECERVKATLSHIYSYEGPAYNVSTNSGGGSSPTVWRFYNRLNGTHFYTADPGERDTVQATLSHIYQLEGPAFYLGQ